MALVIYELVTTTNVYDYLCHSGNIAVRERERHFFFTISNAAHSLALQQEGKALSKKNTSKKLS
jgi:hypothetical protein